MSFYETFLSLCDIKGVAPTRAALDAGLSKSAPAKWKSTPDIFPTNETIYKLANYFNVPVNYFTKGKEATTLDLEAFPEIMMIARAGTKMPATVRSELLNYAKYLFPEAFEDD